MKVRYNGEQRMEQRIKVVCTKDQKKWLMFQAKCKEFCPFVFDKNVVCNDNCKACIENNIDWEITDKE